MRVVGDFVYGLLHVIKVTGGSLLYRYPYRTSAEGLRADWVNIGKDIESVMGKLQGSGDDGQRE